MGGTAPAPGRRHGRWGLGLSGVVVWCVARLSHQLSAAAGDAPHPGVFSRLGVLDVQSNTSPRPSGRKPHWARHLAALATKAREISGLGVVVEGGSCSEPRDRLRVATIRFPGTGVVEHHLIFLPTHLFAFAGGASYREIRIDGPEVCGPGPILFKKNVQPRRLHHKTDRESLWCRRPACTCR